MFMFRSSIIIMLAIIGFFTIIYGLPGAWAADTSSVFKHAGLIGVWSPDCQKAVSLENPRAVYGISPDGVYHTVTFDGRTIWRRDMVRDAHQLDTHFLTFSITTTGHPQMNVKVELVGGRLRTVSAVGRDGHVYIEHGHTLSNDKPALILEKCSSSTPASWE